MRVLALVLWELLRLVLVALLELALVPLRAKWASERSCSARNRSSQESA
jgi:hypothetical protein